MLESTHRNWRIRIIPRGMIAIPFDYTFLFRRENAARDYKFLGFPVRWKKLINILKAPLCSSDPFYYIWINWSLNVCAIPYFHGSSFFWDLSPSASLCLWLKLQSFILHREENVRYIPMQKLSRESKFVKVSGTSELKSRKSKHPLCKVTAGKERQLLGFECLIMRN